jgi:hypothetical protein
MKYKLNATPLEIILFVVFVFYLVFQPTTPPMLNGVLNTSLGMGAVIVMTLYLFMNTHPILGILSVFVAYELLRRSSSAVAQLLQPSAQVVKDEELRQMNPTISASLEEDVISQMAPIPILETAASFQPTYSNGFAGASQF